MIPKKQYQAKFIVAKDTKNKDRLAFLLQNAYSFGIISWKSKIYFMI